MEINSLDSSNTPPNLNDRYFLFFLFKTNRSSQEVVCQYCQKKVWTNLMPKTTYLTFMICLIIILLANFWICIIFVPLVLLLSQTLYHVCPLCKSDIGTNNRIFNHLPIEDKVYFCSFH